jgi:hypothetical protein
MAKDSFFIRATQTTTLDQTWQNAEIDLGFVVDALAKSVLRIHSIQVKYQDDTANGPPVPGNLGGGGSSYLAYAVTTQPIGAADSVDLSEKSLIASGIYEVATNGTPGAAATNYMLISDKSDLAPQDFTNGYLVGTSTIYLNTYQDAQMGPGENRVSVILECTTEKLTQSGAMALALSQQ